MNHCVLRWSSELVSVETLCLMLLTAPLALPVPALLGLELEQLSVIVVVPSLQF